MSSPSEFVCSPLVPEPTVFLYLVGSRLSGMHGRRDAGRRNTMQEIIGLHSSAPCDMCSTEQAMREHHNSS